MKTIVLFFSRSGNTKRIAEELAKKYSADIEEIFEVKKTFLLNGIFKAIKRQKTAILPIKSTLEEYEKIVLMSPIWASNPAPAFNNMVDMLPKNKSVEVIMVSASGDTKSSQSKTIEMIKSKNCTVVDYKDIKTSK